MESSAEAGYPEIYVGPTCHVQTATSRFGPDADEDIKVWIFQNPQMNDLESDDEEDEGESDDDDDYDDDDDEDDADLEVLDAPNGPAVSATAAPGSETDHGFPPRIASARCNLTALSQRYNLYFAAYQDRVYVFRPQRAPRILPPPSLILHPRPSQLGLLYGGYIDSVFGHQINHLIVGNLGNLEIVLFAYDDGDVMAYYTHAIARCIAAGGDHGRSSSRGRARAAHPKPFLHDNVGKSAWGLAVHEQSRLIAVGSNLHEVTVFAFAVARDKAADESLPVQGPAALQRYFRKRTRTWRITLPLGPQGSNIPNLDFVDDEAGEAEKVVAVDIYGQAWILDIWEVGSCPVRWRDYTIRDRMHTNSRGWGVVVLPDRSFKPTKTIREAFGLPGNEIIPSKPGWLETTCSLYYVPELATDARSVLVNRSQYDYGAVHNAVKQADWGRFYDDVHTWELTSESEDDPDDAAMELEPAAGELAQSAASDGGRGEPRTVEARSDASSFDTNTATAESRQLRRTIIPSFGEVHELDESVAKHMAFSRAHEARQGRTKPVEFEDTQLPARLAKRFCLLRTSQVDVELQPFDPAETSIVCRYVLTAHNRHGINAPLELHPHYAERVNMVIHVPELNLVVAGSPVGRVALITLTRAAGRVHHLAVRRGFRVDRVLPRRSEDALRPACTLIGIAMSPVPTDRGSRLNLYPPRGGTPPLMYRLILHYRDHTILMYDIARARDGGDLMVF